MLYFYAAYADESMIGSAEKQLGALLLDTEAGRVCLSSKDVLRSITEAQRGQDGQ